MEFVSIIAFIFALYVLPISIIGICVYVYVEMKEIKSEMKELSKEFDQVEEKMTKMIESH